MIILKCDVIVFKKLCCQNIFCLHENEKPAFSNSSGLKSVSEKLCLCNGLMWTVGLTIEIKLSFKFLRRTSSVDEVLYLST